MTGTQLNGDLDRFITGIPKAELHVHIEGTLEPELLLALAARNRIPTKFGSAQDVRAACAFCNLQGFLDLYYEGTRVLLTHADFYELTYAYLQRAHNQNVLHAEIHFDAQTHTARGVPFATVVEGIHAAVADAETQLGISANLILCFLRHLEEADAFRTLEAALSYRSWIIAVGLDSSELGNPPAKFAGVFRQAREAGFRAVAHAGEEGPAPYISEALERLGVDRIDHGNHAMDDPRLVRELARRKIPLTVCPLSNRALNVVPDLSKHDLKRMMQCGLMVTVNSDDPAYFGGYVNENYRVIAQALSLTKEDIAVLARNSLLSTFVEPGRKAAMISRLDAFLRENARIEIASVDR